MKMVVTCAGLEAGIEGATHDVGKQRSKRVRARQKVAEEAEASNQGEDSGNVA